MRRSKRVINLVDHYMADTLKLELISIKREFNDAARRSNNDLWTVPPYPLHLAIWVGTSNNCHGLETCPKEQGFCRSYNLESNFS